MVIRLTTLRFGVAVEERGSRILLQVRLGDAKMKVHGSGRGGRLRIGGIVPDGDLGPVRLLM